MPEGEKIFVLSCILADRPRPGHSSSEADAPVCCCSSLYVWIEEYEKTFVYGMRGFHTAKSLPIAVPQSAGHYAIPRKFKIVGGCLRILEAFKEIPRVGDYAP